MNGGPYYLTIGDFNRDGCPDIISANDGSNNVGVLLNAANGNWHFWRRDLLWSGRRLHFRQRGRYQWRRSR